MVSMMLSPAIHFALTALIATSILVLSSTQPVVAQEDEGKIVKIIFKVLESADAEVQEKMLKLEQRGGDIPLIAVAYRTQALAEYDDAQQALWFGNEDLAKGRAMKAMELFKQATDMLGSLEQGNEESDFLVEVDDRIASLEHKAEYLNVLAKSNGASVGFADYNSAIKSVKVALEDGSIEDAVEQLERAKSILVDVQNDIQKASDSRQEERMKGFVKNIVTRLSKIVSEVQADDQITNSTSFVQEINTIIEQLKNATNIDEIIKITDDSSRLQTVIKEYSSKGDKESIKEEGSGSEETGSNDSDKDENDNDSDGKDNSGRSDDDDNSGRSDDDDNSGRSDDDDNSGRSDDD
jgi:hypothetical protein